MEKRAAGYGQSKHEDAVVPSPGKTGIATDSGKMSIAIVHSGLREGNLDALC